MNGTENIAIKDYTKSHRLFEERASKKILHGLDELLVYDDDHDGVEINKIVVYHCAPNLNTIYRTSHGIPVCPKCGRTTKAIHAYRERLLDDIPHNGCRVVLRVLFSTYECICGSIITPPLRCASPNDKTTTRLIEAIADASFSRRKTFSEVAEDFHVSDTLVHKAFSDAIEKRSAETLYCAYPHLCIDEVVIHTKKQKAPATASSGKKETGTLCVSILATELNGGDETKPNQAIVAFEYPKKRDILNVTEILEKLDHPEIVETFTMDMNVAYREAVRTVLPGCRIIVDRYHLVQSLNEKVGKTAQLLYAEKRNKARAALMQLIDDETQALAEEIDNTDVDVSDTSDIATALDALYEDERRKAYKKKIRKIEVTTDAQRDAKAELLFLVDNYHNRWFTTNPENLSDYGKARLNRLIKKYPDFGELYQWKELLRYNFFEAETPEKAREIADTIEAQIHSGKTYRPLKTYFNTLNHSDWTPWIYEYFNDPPGKRYSNAAMEEFNRDVKEINRTAKGLTPEVLRYKVLFGDIIYHTRDRHQTCDELNHTMMLYYNCHKMGREEYMSSLIAFNSAQFVAVALKCGIIASTYNETPISILQRLGNDSVRYEKWQEFLDALVETEHDPKPAVRLFDSYPVFKPFPIASGDQVSDPIAFAVLTEDVDALTADKVKMDYSKFDKPPHDKKLWISPNTPLLPGENR